MGAFAEGALVNQLTSTVASGGNLTLTVSSTTWHRITGSTTHTITLPDATTMRIGREFVVANASTGDVTVNFDGASLAALVAPGRQRIFRLYGNGTAAGDYVISDQFDTQGPLALHETTGTADDKLNIRANQVVGSEGNTISTPPIDDIINVFANATIDFRSGVATGGESPGGAILTDGGVFTLPSVTAGQFTRMALVYKSADNKIDTTFATAAASQGALTNAGILFAGLDGVPIGYIDLESDGSFDFKTPGSTATTYIENGGIVRFGSGSSAGAAGDTSFKAQSISANVIKIKKGFLILDDGRELVTYDGADNNVDLDFNLKSAVNTLGVTAPSATTTYYLYLDLSFLPASTVAVGDAGRVAYQVQSGTGGMFVVLTSTPENTTTSRYVPLAVLKTDGSSDYTEFEDLARRRHDSASVAVSPLVGTPLDQVSIMSVGAVANAQQALSSADFPNTTTLNIFSLEDSSSDFGTGGNFTENGSPKFRGKGFYGRETILDCDGNLANTLSSTNAEFDIVANTDNFTVGVWARANWKSGAGVTRLFGKYDGGTDTDYIIEWNPTVILFYVGSVTPVTVSNTNELFSDGDWLHLVMANDTTNFTAYINGQAVGTASVGSDNATVNPLEICSADGSAPFTGQLQDFFFHKGTTLTAAQVNIIYS